MYFEYVHRDIIVVTETWLTNDYTHLFNMNGYVSFHTIRFRRTLLLVWVEGHRSYMWIGTSSCFEDLVYL